MDKTTYFACIDIGFPTAIRKIQFDIYDDELEDMTEEEIDDYLYMAAKETLEGNAVINIYYEQIHEKSENS